MSHSLTVWSAQPLPQPAGSRPDVPHHLWQNQVSVATALHWALCAARGLPSRARGHLPGVPAGARLDRGRDAGRKQGHCLVFCLCWEAMLSPFLCDVLPSLGFLERTLPGSSFCLRAWSFLVSSPRPLLPFPRTSCVGGLGAQTAGPSLYTPSLAGALLFHGSKYDLNADAPPIKVSNPGLSLSLSFKPQTLLPSISVQVSRGHLTPPISKAAFPLLLPSPPLTTAFCGSARTQAPSGCSGNSPAVSP